MKNQQNQTLHPHSSQKLFEFSQIQWLWKLSKRISQEHPIVICILLHSPSSAHSFIKSREKETEM